LEFSSMKNHESSPRLSDSAVRPCSPDGGSILMTSAPSHPSIWVELGPASYWVRSSTRIPSSAFIFPHMGDARRAPQTPRAPRPGEAGTLRDCRENSLRLIRGKTNRLCARLVIGDHVDHRRLAGRERALQGRTNVVWFLDELAVRAELHGDPVVAREAESPP